MKEPDSVRIIRARLAAWEATRATGRRYYSTEDLRFLPPIAASDPIVTGTTRGGLTSGAGATIQRDGRRVRPKGDRLVEAATLELFERKLHELDKRGWVVTSAIDLMDDGQTIRCWMRRPRRGRQR